MTAGLVDLRSRSDAPRLHNGPSSHPIAQGLVNAAWGSPLLDLFGEAPLTAPSVRGGHDPLGGSIGNASFNTSPHYWRALVNVTSNTPCSMFAVVWLESTSQRGIVVGLGDSANADTGINIGVGATAPDATGNNLVGVRGGINYDASSAAIGTGWHTIGKTTDGSSNEAWYVDGVRVSTSGTGASFNISSGTARFLMLQHGGNTGLGPTAGVHTFMGAAWNRILRDGEFAKLHDDPYLICRRPLNVALLAQPASGSTVNGALNATLSLTATIAGTRTVNGALNASLALTATVAGTRTVLGALAVTPALTATVAGVPTVLGTLNASLALTATVAGTRTVLGALAVSPILTATVAGTPTVLGALNATLSLAATIAGTPTVLGALAATPALTATVAGTRTVNGALNASLALTATVAGQVAGPIPGHLDAALTLTATLAGTRTVLGALAASPILTATVAGTRTVLGELAANPTLIATIIGDHVVAGVAQAELVLTADASGLRTVLGVAQAELVLTATALGAQSAPPSQPYYVTLGARSTVTAALHAHSKTAAQIHPRSTVHLEINR